MAKFGIYSTAGVKKAEGYPTFTGTYMKAGVLDFREIASHTPINWSVGDYVDYTRTGLRYKLYKLPQMKKQARSNTYGGAYVYQSVQFHDASYDLELCPFRDLVKGDNRVHFSTQPMISTFENVAGIATRLQACLDDMYGSGSWNIRLATVAMGATQAVVDLMNEARNFSVQGVSLIGALEKIYEVWPEIGWVYGVVNGVNTITIGGAGLNLSTSQSYSYGKGSGLKDITRVATNADELANRLYVYGSSRNMMSGWYRSKNIKDAESVDIQHLMIPIANWGTTEVEEVDLPDPAKAFVDDAASIARIGLRPKTIYFDGTGDQEEIYPTIRGMKISDVIAAVPAGTRYSPNTSIYTDTGVRVDTVRSVETNFDSGLSAESGKQTILSEYGTFSENSPIVILAGDKERTVTLYSKVITVPESGIINLSAIFSLDGTITASDASLVAYIEAVDSSNTSLGKSYVELTQEGSNWRFSDAAIEKFGLTFAQNDTVTIRLVVKVVASAISSVDRQYVVGVNGELSASLERFRSRTFKITIRQIGFDISAQAALGNGKTIHFRTGDCAGRTFTIKNCTYQADTDSWLLEIIRSEDSSLSQWFPNSTYPVAADDEFVLLDIAMPDSYVLVAENKLLAAAQDYLGWSAKEVWQYTPDIDAKFMIEQSRVILPAQYITLGDTDVVDGDADQLVDTVNINEGESTIPTYKVTLRERKRVKTSTSATVEPINSNPVSSATPVNLNRPGSSFFEEDGDGNIKLKDEYGGLWTKGFLTAGGVGQSSGGGGGGVDIVRVWKSLQNQDTINTYNAYKISTAHLPTLGTGLAYTDNQGSGESLATTLSIASGYKLPTTEEWNSVAGSVEALQSLQSQIDSVASRDNFDELTATALFADVLAASDIYGELHGNAETASYLVGSSYSAGSDSVPVYFSGGRPVACTASSLFASLTSATQKNLSITIAGQTREIAALYATYDGSGNTITAHYATASALNGVSNRVTALEGRQNWDEIFGLDENGNVYVKKNGNAARGFWTYGFVTAGGVGTGGGGGGGDVDLTRLWKSLQNQDTINTYNAYKISTAHLPTLGTGLAYTDNQGSGAGLTTTLSIASGYKLPTTEEWANVADNLNSLQALQAQVDSVATRDNFDELTASALFSDIVAGTTGYFETVYGSLEGNASSATYATSAGSATSAGYASSAGSATYDSDSENISTCFSTISAALKSLQSQIDSVATKNAFDELVASVISADTIAAASFFGALHGNADSATNATNAAYATYDTASENIASNFTTVGAALKSLQAQIDSVAANRAFDELTVTAGYFDMLSVGANLNVAGTIYSVKGIYSSGYVTAGAVGASSDERLKDDITTISEERAKDVIMALRPCEWVWNEKHSSLEGRSSAGLIAQEVRDILPDMVYEVDGELSLLHNVLHGYQISMLQDHETRIEELEKEVTALRKENTELKSRITT